MSPSTRLRASSLVVTLAAAVAVLATPARAAAQLGYEVLHSFASGPGAHPRALIQAADGLFYGTTHSGGLWNVGTAFRMAADGTVTVLHEFAGGATDGADPGAPLVQATDGNFYGTTIYGGANGIGIVFRMTPQGTVTLLHSFTRDEGWMASALIQAADGQLYGTTSQFVGGTPTNGAFRVTLQGELTVLYRFFTFTGGVSAPVQVSDGNFYFTTLAGTYRQGAAYRMTPDGTVTLVHTFTGDPFSPASQPPSLVLGTDGELYGTTHGSSSVDKGYAFHMTREGVVTVLHAFVGGADGAKPGALISGTGGTLLGATASEGTGGLGTLFQLTTAGAYSIQHAFTPDDAVVPGDAPLMLATDGQIYGASFGSVNTGDVGSLFRLTVAGVGTILHRFTRGTDGASPRAPLVQAEDGNFYGTTYRGGTSNLGTVFRVSSTGILSTLHTFTGGADGEYPVASLIQAADGEFYGTSASGGAFNCGTIFKVSATGTLSVLHHFDPIHALDGCYPGTPLTQGDDGSFYGTTPLGGADGAGSVFRMTADGTVTVLHSFPHVPNEPCCWSVEPGALTKGADGTLYGVTAMDGWYEAGTIFTVSTAGTFAGLYEFGADGLSRPSTLILAADGSFYGAAAPRQVFRLTTGGTLTVVHEFSAVEGYSEPFSVAANGDVLLLSRAGGTAGQGRVVRMTEDGLVTVLHNFAAAAAISIDPTLPPGYVPYKSLVQATDGNFYGTTDSDGLYGSGNVFRLIPTTAAAMVSPQPGTVLKGTSVTFGWTAAAGVSRYWLYVGTTPGGVELFNEDAATSLSATVTGLPANGSTLYLRLWSLLGADWVFDDYTYTAVSPAPAVLTTPAPGSILSTPAVSLAWTAGFGVAGYWLHLGTSPGAADLWSEDQGSSLSTSVIGLPADGRTVYVRLWSRIGGGWHFNDYTYAAAAPAARLTTPPPGSMLSGASVDFAWSSGSGVSSYWLYVGTSLGAADLFNQDAGVARSQTVTGIPTDGRRIFVRLWSEISGTWAFTDSVYETRAGTTPEAQLTTPPPGRTLTATTVPFEWTNGEGATQYWLSVGTAPGAGDLFYRDAGTSTTQTVAGLPADGRTLFVRLWSLVGGTWRFSDYPYPAVSGRARLTLPAPGSTLTAAVVPFQWTPGSGVTQYWLSIGWGPGGANLFDEDEGTRLTTTAAGLPTDGRPLYVRLWSLIGGTWQWDDYSYTAVTPHAQMTSPVPGSTLTASSVSFEWNPGTAVTGYWLQLGSTLGGADLYTRDEGQHRSAPVMGLPTDGRVVYARLWSLVGDGWQFNDYSYTSTTPEAQMIWPVPGRDLPGAVAWFEWTRGTGVSRYRLSVGFRVGGAEIASSEGVNPGAMVIGLPTERLLVYVRLWSFISGTWRFHDYAYRPHAG